MLLRGRNTWGYSHVKGGDPRRLSICTVRFLLTIVTCNFYSARCSRHEKIVYNFHDIKLPVDTIDCRSFLKHILKAHDILHVVHNNRRLDLHETTRVVDLS